VYCCGELVEAKERVVGGRWMEGGGIKSLITVFKLLLWLGEGVVGGVRREGCVEQILDGSHCEDL
jgi:hypothetical protein